MTLPSTLAGFNYMSHLSFLINKEYPIYRNNIYLYNLLRFFDIYSHWSIYSDTKDNAHLILYLWHIIKLFSKNKHFNNNFFWNLFDFLTYFNSFAVHYKAKNHLGILIYFIFKRFKLIY